jgi:hypothetical protein
MRIVAAATVLAVGMTASVAAKAAGEFSHQGWSGHAVFDGGKFLQCQMWMSAINNYDLVLALDSSGDLRLGLRSKRIDTGLDGLFGVKRDRRIQLDDGPVLIKAFDAVGRTARSTSLKDTDWPQRLRDGKLLRINTGGRVRLFHLTGIKEAMGMLYACAAKHRGA